MKRISKFASIILSIVIILTMSVGIVYADGTKVSLQGSTFIINGSVSDYSRITLLVYTPERGGVSSLCHFDGINEVKGDFSFSVPISADSTTGVYTFVIGYDGAKPSKETLTCGYYGNNSIVKDFSAEGKITSNGTVTGVCTLSSYDEESTAPTVAVAVYEKLSNGTARLVSANYSNTVISENGKYVIKAQVTLPENTQNYFAKALLLDGITNIMPITDGIVIE